MTENPIADRAKELFMAGYNCSQSVFMAFAERYGFDKEKAAELAFSFGGGMGGQRGVCGSVSGMLMAFGMIFGKECPLGDNVAKAKHYKTIQNLCAEFKNRNGSMICADLLKGINLQKTPEQRTAGYYRKRPCPDMVHCSAKILEDYISECNNNKDRENTK